MSTNNELPEAFQLTEEQKEVKAYTIGTISIDADGIWHCHYIGHHEVLRKKYFGNGVVSYRNVREMLDIVGSRLNNKQSVYLDKIQEVENATTITETDGIKAEPSIP